MAVEFLWCNPAIAEENKISAQSQLAAAAPPREVTPGLHGGINRPGFVAKIDAPDATGCFIAVNPKTNQVFVYTHHSPHEENAPTRQGTKALGPQEMDDLVILCNPSRPVKYTIGTGGAKNNQLDPDQLSTIERICGANNLPMPVVDGRPRPPSATTWAQYKVA